MKRILLPAAALLALGGWFYYTHAPVDHRECTSPFDPDIWDCDWWPKRD